MTEAVFYHLLRKPLEKALPELLEKSYERGWRVVVQAGSDDPAKMKAAFAKSLRGTTDCATYLACVQALTAGQTIHWRGASSRFDIWDGFEPGEGAYDVWFYGGDGRVNTGPPQNQIHVP